MNRVITIRSSSLSAANADDIDHINDVAKLLENRLESGGVDVLFTFVPSPGEHPAQNFLDALSLVLGGIGLLALLLSGFLIINTSRPSWHSMFARSGL